MKWFLSIWRAKKQRPRRREEGVALLSVVIIVAVMIASTAEFAYNTEVDLAGALNTRDELQAHYMARAGMNISRLMLRVQDKVIDQNKQLFGGMDLQISDYVPYLISALGSKEGAQMFGSFLGVDTESIKGLGLEGGTFDVQMDSLDGKLNLNCAGGANTGNPTVERFAAALASLFLPTRYNRIFEEPDDEGNYADRLEMMRAIIDWPDQDMVMFGSTAPEDYRYNTGKDPYEIKNQYYDTVEEIRLVKGVTEDFYAAFSEAFTVYGGCKINVNLAAPSLLTALILHGALTASDPNLRPENLMLLVRYLAHIRELKNGFLDLTDFIRTVEDPKGAMTMVMAMQSLLGGSGEQQSTPPVNGIKLDQKKIQDMVVVGGPRRIWQITATASVGRVDKKIVAVWDTKHISMTSGRDNVGAGGYLYWREE